MSRTPPPSPTADDATDGASHFSSDVAFSPRVKAVQVRKGSRASYERVEAAGGWDTVLDDELRGFIARQTSIYMATASADGQPYIQHRGGPPGFLHVLDDRTIAFADFDGNRQYISQGNLEENAKAQLFLMEYTTRRRIKIWGTARVVEDDPELVRSLMPEGYHAKASQAIVFEVAALDRNCPQHIPQRFDAIDVQAAIAKRDARILDLENRLRGAGLSTTA